MRWSKLKAKTEALFAQSIQGRVELRATNYRGAHDETGRGYITVDGKEVWNMCSLRFMAAEYPKVEEIKEEKKISARAAQIITDAQLEKDGVLSQWGYYRTLENYCISSIESSLLSANPLAKSLAILDFRVGKRTLEKLDVSADHPMVQYFFNLRCKAESLSLTHNSSGTPNGAPCI
jgi:hypothetical protein